MTGNYLTGVGINEILLKTIKSLDLKFEFKKNPEIDRALWLVSE